MKLSINNYKNINNLDLDIDENKINFIFGISGSGKTSIGQSLCKIIGEDEVTIGKDISDVKILIDNKDVDENKVNLYNESIVNSLIVQNEMNSNVYHVIFSNDNDIMEKKREFQLMIKELSKYKDDLCQYMGKIDILIKNYGGKLTVNNDLPATSKIIKFEKELNNIENEKYIDIIKNNGSNYLKWLTEGINFKLYENTKICPFCEQHVSQLRVKEIDDLSSFKPKNFDILFDNTNILYELNIPLIDYSSSDEIKKMKEKIIEKIKLKNEILNIINIIDYYLIDNYNPSDISTIDVSSEFKNTFPDITDSISIVNNNIIELKKILGELKHTTNKIIHDNLTLLNRYIEKFGIPYKFKLNKYNIEDKKADYILYHINDAVKKHRINGLSYGERNIISLLLFLMSNQSEIVVIDDPASSYDDYRRKIIFDLLYYLQKSKTFIILSHDVVFIKYAVFNRKQGAKSKASARLKMFFMNTGKTISFENYDSFISIKDIDYSDFDTMENHVKNHIDNHKLSYFRKIINLRILAENKKNEDNDYEIIYNYLSAILHKESKDVIIKKLKNVGFDEQQIIVKIREKFSVEIEEIPDNIFFDFDLSQLTNFEKIFYYRDDIKDDIIKDEFNNIIHMNCSYIISLNPYKYNYFSPYVYRMINK